MKVIALMAICLVSPSFAATMDDYVNCSLIYGALFQAAKNSDSSEMIAYSRSRLQIVIPFLQKNQENPVAKAKLREAAIRLEDEVRFQFVQRATDAINRNDANALKASMGRVITCDKAFGLPTFPLPIHPPQSQTSKKFFDGFYEGCVAKQRSAPSPFGDSQLKAYCSCMTDRARSAGLTPTSSDSEVGKVVRDSNNDCINSIK